jgi:hypothetical protein
MVFGKRIALLPTTNELFKYKFCANEVADNLPVTNVGKSTPTNIVFDVLVLKLIGDSCEIFTVDILFLS